MTDAAWFPAPPEPVWRWGSAAKDRSPRLAAAVSVALHLAILAAAIMLLRAPVHERAEERRVNVEIVDARLFEPPPVPEETPADPDTARFAPEQEPEALPETLPETRPDGLIVAHTLRSGTVLDDPRSADAKAALPLMKSDERMLQLCSIEALEQVASLGDDYTPDLIVSYAMDDVRLKGDTARAPGAAVRSRGQWYNLRFECQVTPDLEHVAAFAFKLGDEIPEAEWESHNLVVGGDLDHH